MKTMNFKSIFSIGKPNFVKNSIFESSDQIDKEIGELIYTNSKEYPENTELSIALIENGEVRYIGTRRVNDEIIQITNEKSAFEICSITKVFTSTLLAMTIEEKGINLEDDIKQYIPFGINTDEKITLLNLSNHTSGLPRLPQNIDFSPWKFKNPYNDYNIDQLHDYLKKSIRLSQISGTKYEYSNLGSALLGYILTEITSSTFENLLKEKIFSVFSMINTSTQKELLKVKLVSGLNHKGKNVNNWDFGAFLPAGGILSTVEDLSKFAIAHLDKNNKMLSITHKSTFKINDYFEVGLGWHLIKNKEGQELLWHNGGSSGYSSSMALNLEKNNGVIILSNVSAKNKHNKNIDQLCFGLNRIINNK